MNIHPRPVCGFFTLIYGTICIYIQGKTGIKVFESIWTYLIFLFLIIVVYIFFLKRYDGDEGDI